MVVGLPSKRLRSGGQPGIIPAHTKLRQGPFGAENHPVPNMSLHRPRLRVVKEQPQASRAPTHHIGSASPLSFHMLLFDHCCMGVPSNVIETSWGV